jgi:hypothetical protein
MRRLDHDGAARIETETLEAMSGQTAALAQGMGRHDKNDSPLGPIWGTILETMRKTVSLRALAIRQAGSIRRR